MFSSTLSHSKKGFDEKETLKREKEFYFLFFISLFSEWSKFILRVMLIKCTKCSLLQNPSRTRATKSYPGIVKGKSVKVIVTWLYPTLCHPMDCSPPGSSVHGIHQSRTLEWIAVPFLTQGLKLSLLLLSFRCKLWGEIKAEDTF